MRGRVLQFKPRMLDSGDVDYIRDIVKKAHQRFVWRRRIRRMLVTSVFVLVVAVIMRLAFGA